MSPIKKYINNVLAQKTEEQEKTEKKMSISKSQQKNITQKEPSSPKPQKVLKTFNRLKSENLSIKNNLYLIKFKKNKNNDRDSKYQKKRGRKI